MLGTKPSCVALGLLLALSGCSETSAEFAEAAPEKSQDPAAEMTVASSDASAPPASSESGPPSVPGTNPPPSGHFATLPVGATLPTEAECAARVRPTPELRGDNAGPNAVRGTSPNGRYPRVTGNFTGSTDEILQWVACKWGIDEDIVRAQAAKESYWHQSGRGDKNADQSACYPALRTNDGTPCAESVGILQVRYLYHMEAFKDGNALLSTAYNADYTYAGWRSCFEGKEAWLNQFEKGGNYAAGDAMGCLGVWFSGRWRTAPAETYIQAVTDYMNQKIWTTQSFGNG